MLRIKGFIICIETMEDERGWAESIPGKDKNLYKIAVENHKMKIPFQICSCRWKDK
jgi:hypothetical protein